MQMIADYITGGRHGLFLSSAMPAEKFEAVFGKPIALVAEIGIFVV